MLNNPVMREPSQRDIFQDETLGDEACLLRADEVLAMRAELGSEELGDQLVDNRQHCQWMSVFKSPLFAFLGTTLIMRVLVAWARTPVRQKC